MRKGVLILLLSFGMFIGSIYYATSPYRAISHREISLDCMLGIGSTFAHPSNGNFYTTVNGNICLFSEDGNLLIQNELSDSFTGSTLFYTNSFLEDEESFVLFNSQDVYVVGAMDLNIKKQYIRSDLVNTSDPIRSNFILGESNDLYFYHNNSIWVHYLNGTNSMIGAIPESSQEIQFGLLSSNLHYIAIYRNFGNVEVYELETMEKMIFQTENHRTAYFPLNSHYIVFTEVSENSIVESYDLKTKKMIFSVHMNFLMDEPSFYENKMLIMDSNLELDNRFEFPDHVQIFDYTSGKQIYDQTFNKGQVYDASIHDYVLINDKVVIIDYNGHNTPDLLILNTRMGNVSDQFEYGLLLLAFSSVILIVVCYFYLKPDHYQFLLDPSMSNLSFVVERTDSQGDEYIARIGKVQDVKWIDILFYMLIITFIINIALNTTPSSDNTGEDLAYSEARTIFHAIFAFVDIAIIGMLTITYLSFQKNKLTKNNKLLYFFGIIFITIVSILLKYYQGFSIGNQVPFYNASIVQILSILKLYILIHLWYLKFEEIPWSKFEESLIKKVIAIIIVFIEFFFITGVY